MDFKKIETKLESFKKIEQKVSNDKNILLINIIKQNSLLTSYVVNAMQNQDLILLLKNKYQIKTPIISEQNKTNYLTKINNLIFKPKQLWIYLTEEQKYSTDSYSRYEANILNKIKNKNVDFITIGSRANEFCKNNNLNVIYQVNNDNKDDQLAWRLTQIIKFLFSEKQYQTLNFVINSNKNKNKNYTILPLVKFDINSLTEQKPDKQKINITDFKIFPNIEQYLNIQVDLFIQNSIQALIIESSFYKSKNELIQINKKLNEINDEITKFNRKLIRIKREREIEEIMLLSSNNKHFFVKGE